MYETKYLHLYKKGNRGYELLRKLILIQNKLTIYYELKEKKEKDIYLHDNEE